MKESKVTKSIAILLNVLLVGTSTFADMGMPGAGPAVVAQPDFVRALTPPDALGYVTDSYQGSTSKPVVLIQDLHANYGVQKKIENILKFLQPQVAQGGRPMILGLEGAWGDLDYGWLRKHTLKAREVAGEFLVKEAEMSGMTKFAMLTDAPLKATGIDDMNEYIANRDLVRKSLYARLELAQKVERLRATVDDSRVNAPAHLRHLWRIEDSFRSGKLDLDGLAKKLHVGPLQDYGAAETALAQAKEEAAAQEPGAFASNIVRADEDLQLLSRLLRQQLTLEEVQVAAKKSPEMLVTIQALIPGENMEIWKEAIRSAIDYYAIALLRDRPMAAKAADLAEQNGDSSVVIVTGGFHTAGIVKLLKSKQMSYMVIAPNVESHTKYDEALYIKRLMGLHLSKQDMIDKGLLKQAAKSAHALTSGEAGNDAGNEVMRTTSDQGPVGAAQTALDTAETGKLKPAAAGGGQGGGTQGPGGPTNTNIEGQEQQATKLAIDALGEEGAKPAEMPNELTAAVDRTVETLPLAGTGKPTAAGAPKVETPTPDKPALTADEAHARDEMDRAGNELPTDPAAAEKDKNGCSFCEFKVGQITPRDGQVEYVTDFVPLLNAVAAAPQAQQLAVYQGGLAVLDVAARVEVASVANSVPHDQLNARIDELATRLRGEIAAHHTPQSQVGTGYVDHFVARMHEAANAHIAGTVLPEITPPLAETYAQVRNTLAQGANIAAVTAGQPNALHRLLGHPTLQLATMLYTGRTTQAAIPEATLHRVIQEDINEGA